MPKKPRAVKVNVKDAGELKVRFTSKGLRAQRKRLGLSAAQYALLAGVTAQSIYNWEHELTRPRKEQLLVLAALRKMGKRKVMAKLAELQAAEPPVDAGKSNAE